MTYVLSWDVSPLIHKKYRVLLSDGRKVDFGDSRYGHYYDRTPLKAWSHLDHLDTNRRERYYMRHYKSYPVWSADWFSKNFLW